MSTLIKSKLSESDVSVEIDIEALLGSSAKNQAVRETFAQMAFDRMFERLESGVDVDGKKMAGYSQSYINSKEFKAYGKDKNSVNMQLTGGMAYSVDILNQSNTKMKLGFVGEDEIVKAYAHMTGYKGHPTLAGKVPVRKFFGWTEKDLKEISDNLRPDTPSKKEKIKDAMILDLISRLVG